MESKVWTAPKKVKSFMFEAGVIYFENFTPLIFLLDPKGWIATEIWDLEKTGFLFINLEILFELILWLKILEVINKNK